MKPEKFKNGFTQVPNYITFDKRLSLKARCVLLLIISRPINWKIRLKELMKHSEKDGKTAFQTALKELLAYDYLALVRVRDEENRKLSGTSYVIGKAVRRVSRSLEMQTTEKPVSQKNGLHRNKEIINTEILNNNHQQQETAAAVDEDFNFFFKKLRTDKQWQSHFYPDLPTDNEPVEVAFDLLLFYFRSHSLKKGELYKNLFEARRHFSHWFNLQKEKSNLLKSLKIEKKRQNSHWRKVSHWHQKFNQIYTRCKNQAFQNLALVDQAYREIIEIQNKLEFIVDLIRNAELILFIQEFQEDCSVLKRKIDNAKSQNRLDWFCEKAQQLTSK